VFVVAVVAGALVYFAYLAFQGAAVDYHTVHAAVALAPTEADRLVGVKGKLVPGTYARSPDGLVAKFEIADEDGAEKLPVRYTGDVSQVFFNEHSEIILQGGMGTDRVFTAQQLTVRCPSKYLTEAEKAELEAQNGDQPAPPPYQPDYFQRGA
jgi:cytochrome c-type biogenesis protein CcmE